MSWQKNEATAAARTALLIIVDDGGYPISPGSDPIAAGAVFVVGVNAPDADLATGTLTNIRRPLVVADDTFTTTHGTEMLTATAHGLQTGDGPFRLTTSDTLPTGLALATDYWIIRSTADDYQLAASLADAYAGTEVTFSDDGTGTHTISDTASTERGIWGHFEYQAAQAETNHDRKFTEVFVDGAITKPAAEGGGSYSCLRMNGGGAHTQVDMLSASSDLWSYVIEAGYTAEQLLRGIARQNLATRSIDTGTGVETTRDLADTKDSHHGTITGSTRTATIDDLD